MVRATIIVSALVAMVATVSAGSLVDVRAKKHIGTGDINAQGLGNHAVNANNLRVQDAAQNVDVLGDKGHGHGVLGGLLKREEAPVRIARKAGVKGKKMNAKKMAAKKPAQQI